MSRSLRITLALLGSSLFGLAVSGQVIYARLSYLWIFLIVSSFLHSRLALSGVELTRRARVRRSQVGQIFEEVFEVHNRSRLPRLWLEVQDQSNLPGARGSRVLTMIIGRRTRSYVSRTRLAARGVYTLGPTQLFSGDLFGFFPVNCQLLSAETLTVLPRVLELQSLPNPPGLLPGGEALRRRTHQITPNAATVREYAHGDSLSRIHWRSTARRERLLVKEFELDPLADVWIFLDAERRCQARLEYTLETDAGSVIFQRSEARMLPSTEEYAATIAASMAQHYLRAGRAVGLVSAGQVLDVLPAEHGARQLGKIMETLALLRAVGDVPFAGLVIGHARYLPRGSTLVLISPSTDKQLVMLVDQLRRLGLRPIVILLNAESFAGNSGSQALSGTLDVMGVPNVLIAEGQPLASALRKLVLVPRALEMI